MRDHYRTLQVTRDAEPEVIERAYKALSRKYHPDRRPEGERGRATREMQAINEAYSVLRDPKKRRAYDASLPSEEGGAWDVFWERGLYGMFSDRFIGKRK
jgi:DnaJ-class molecular chaperone